LTWKLTLLRFAAFLLVPVALACGSDGDGGGTTPMASPTSFDQPVRPDQAIPTEQVQVVNAIPAGGHWVVGDNNFVVGITDADDEPQGGATVEITFFDNANTPQQRERFTATATQSAPGVGPEVVHIHGDGEEHVHGGQDENRVGYYTRVTFDQPGIWGASVKATLKDGTIGVSNVAFEVKADAPVPLPGEPAIASDNLTAADVDDIKEIDSGTPPNDMHDVKIKDAMASGRPLVIVFSTPAFCTSRFCGPVNEEVEALHEKYHEAVDFVHVEIYRNFTTQQFNPTVQEWILEPGPRVLEPVVYLVDSKGVIYDRYEGPVAANILEPAVQAIAGGATYE